MKKFATLTLMLATMGLTAYGTEPADTTQVVSDTTQVVPDINPQDPDYNYGDDQTDTAQVAAGFKLVEQNIILKIGESRQLHVTPNDAKVNWFESWGLANNPVTIIDENGMVTALRSGNDVVGVETIGGFSMKYCNVTVIDEGSIRKDCKQLNPTNEIEWTDVRFTLTDDGKFTAQGAFYGSGAQPNYLNYIVTDQCLLMWFEINYEDSTMMFYSQPFKLEIENCNAQEYSIYLNNKVQTVESQSKFMRYALARGSSAGSTTNTESIFLIKYDDRIYDLKGHKLESQPANGIYIRNGKKYYSF